MGFNMAKGTSVSVELRNLVFGLGWKTPDQQGGEEYDLDVSAFLLDSNRKLPKEEYLVYYNNLRSTDGSVSSGGDNRSGSDDGDAEAINVSLDKVYRNITEILFVVSIHEARARRQRFQAVRNAYIRAVNSDNNEEVFQIKKLEEEALPNTLSMECGRLLRDPSNRWKFESKIVFHDCELEGVIEKYWSGSL